MDWHLTLTSTIDYRYDIYSSADLTGHSNTQKHAKNAAQASMSGQNSGPISVQIVQQDPTLDTRMMRSPKKNGSDPMFGSTSNSGRPQYTKRYRKEWEELDELKCK